jgi:hypothetical protein
MLHNVFTEIISCGILPALSEHISMHARKLGINQNQHLRNYEKAEFERLMGLNGFEVLSCILPMCTGQNFFQTFCTRVAESALLEMVLHIEVSNYTPGQFFYGDFTSR